MAHFNTDKIRIKLGKQGQYSEEAKAHVYTSLLTQTKKALAEGKRVIVDGTFYKKELRDPFLALAVHFAIPIHWVELRAGEAVIKERVSKKRLYSEADFTVYEKIKALYEPLEEEHLVLDTDRFSVAEMITQITEFLSD